MQIIKYTADYKSQWNEFVPKSISGCFLQDRDFMEYHSDRFEDHSLMFFDDDELIACLPAHLSDNCLKSHQGLTYAGMLYCDLLKKEESGGIEFAFAKAELHSKTLQHLINYVKEKSIDAIHIKLPPRFYDKDYEFHFQKLIDVDFEISINLQDFYVDFLQPWKPSSKKTAGYRNGKFNSLELKPVHDFERFWNLILILQLERRHQSTPVHSLEEIQLLQNRFPDQIMGYEVHLKNELVAGAVLFDFDSILKIQYAAGSQAGFESRAMDYLFLEMIRMAKESGKTYIDLGTANNDDGSIDKGLRRFKEELGATDTAAVTMKLNLNQ